MTFTSDNNDDKENKNILWRGLTQAQTKAYLKSIKKWGIEKKETIIAENDFLVKFDIDAANMELLESLIQCEKQSSGKGKGPSLKLGAQPVPVKVTIARIRALTELYAISDTLDDLQLPSKIRAVNNWTCNWTEKEDIQLLRSKSRFLLLILVRLKLNDKNRDLIFKACLALFEGKLEKDDFEVWFKQNESTRPI